MIAAWLLLAAQAAAVPHAANTGAARSVELAPPAPPANWLALPELRYRRRPDLLTADLSGYVRDEVRAGRCAAARLPDGSMGVAVDLAVLVSSAGPVRRIVPHAIGCPTVEQYASGLIERMARDNLDTMGDDAWFHTVLDFAWHD